MNNKITRQRLKTFFVYDTVKMLAVLAVVLISVIIVFNYFSKRPTLSQTFSVLVDNVEVISGDEQQSFYEKVSYGKEDKSRYGLSYNVLAGNVNTISPSSGSPMETLVQTYVGTGDDDVVIAGKTVATYYLGRGVAMTFDTLLSMLNSFLYTDNGFYSSKLDSVGDINEDAVRAYFLKTYAKDSRFLTESKREEGIKNEIERIKGFKTNGDIFEKLIEVCPSIFASDPELTSFTLGGHTFTGNYALNLGALGQGFLNVYKVKQTVNEEEIDTTNGVYLLLGNRLEDGGDSAFEALAFIATLATEYSSVLEG